MSKQSEIKNKIWKNSYPKNVKSEYDIPKQSYIEAIEEIADKYPDNTALYFLGSEFSYKEMKSYIARFASALKKLNIKKEDKVVIYLPNCPQFVFGYLGALKIGAITVPINPLFTKSEIQYILNDSEAETVICLDINHRNVLEIKDETKVKNIIVTNVADYISPAKSFLGKLLKKIPSEKYDKNKVHDFRDLMKIDELETNIKINPEDLAAIQYTGGTTGLSKGVMLTHGNIVSDRFLAYTMMEQFVDKSGENILALLPFFHIYGQVVLLGNSLAYGHSLLILPKLDLPLLLNSVKKYKSTIFYGIPTLYNAILKQQGFEEYLSSVKFFFSGADFLHSSTVDEWKKKTGKDIIQGYGLSETSPITHVTPFDKVKANSFGIPIPNTHAALIGIKDKKIINKIDAEGELVINGPQVMQGYWKKDEENKNAFIKINNEKWFRTGDLAKFDKDGYFYFVDRIKDIVKYKGYLVVPAEIETLLYKHPKIREAAVIGVPDPQVGETIKAVIVLNEEAKVTAEEIKQWCKDKIAPYKIPKIIEFKQELPKTIIGKVLRRKLRENK